MKHKLKKWHIALMSFLTLFIAVFASLFSLRADTVDEETGEVLTDNWELSTVFYDSTVDAGTTPLTEINWDASDGSYKQGNPRVITVQINYKNNSAVTTYQPGELKLSVPSLLYEYLSTPCDVQVVLGANDPTHSNYAWTYLNGKTSPSLHNENLIFYNANIIEEKSNFEGSIQIQYTMTPKTHSPEKGLDQCSNSHELDLISTLSYDKVNEDLSVEKINILSNQISYKCIRTYTHPWTKIEYGIKKTAQQLNGGDGLIDNFNDYYWVDYRFTPSGSAEVQYPYYYVNNFQIRDTFPDDCIVYNGYTYEQLTPENNIYTVSQTIRDYRYKYNYLSFIVGYPKNIYNEEAGNLEITNTGYLYGNYLTDYEYLAEDDVSLNLADFVFNYDGNLYSITKKTIDNGDLFFESLTGNDLEIGNKGVFECSLSPYAIYTGNNMDIKIGDDLLYITSNNNSTYRKLEENEYYFSKITFPNGLYNINKQLIAANKYDIELWVKYAEEDIYTRYSSFKNKSNATTYTYWNFTKDQHVTGFYFIIKNIKESVINMPIPTNGNSLNYNIHCQISINNATNIADNGTVYNFTYLEILQNGILQNEPTIDSYANFITQEEIATFDQNKYGHYLQRSSSNIIYNQYQIESPVYKITPAKTMSTIKQDAINEHFTGKATLKMTLDTTHLWNEHECLVYANNIPDSQKILGFNFYDLLPRGMILNSTTEEIINSFTQSNTSVLSMYKQDGTKITNIANYFSECANVYITENWKHTGRTHVKIEIQFDEPLIVTINKANHHAFEFFSCMYDFIIPYDSYLEYGARWMNRVYLDYYQRNTSEIFTISNTYSSIDNGKFDSDETDINQNNNITETIGYFSSSITINNVVSTHQDVTTYVKTDQSDYSTGIVDASCDSEYEYKLRVRTGSADVTNLIIYTNIEEAQQGKSRWKGKFLDIDTSYAESKGYTVKPYYSENSAASNLYNEDGTLNSDWKEYIPDTPEIVANGLAITFDENFKTYNSSDYLYIYYYYNDKLYRSNQYYNSTLAGKTIEIPSTDVYFYWYTSSSGNSAYGFKVNNIEPKVVATTLGSTVTSLPNYIPIELTGTNYPETSHNPYENNSKLLWHYTYTDSLIVQEYQEHIDKTKVKSLAFEYLDSNENYAILPANSLTYVLIKMKSPADESIKTLARMDCWTQWNAIDEFDQPVDFITGINSNIVKVALPNSVKTDDMPSISLKFIKEIQGETSDFDNLKLNKTDEHIFMIRLTSLTQNDDGTYNQVTGLLSSTQGLVITQIPIGTYLLEELDDNYFNFVEFTNNNAPEITIEGVTFERTDQGYIITVSENLAETVEFNIKVTNEIENERFYEDKDNKENLFLKNKIEEDSV